ncbi:RNA polymerase sigma factor SigZ [Dictyobacter kobayashii]|uniref:RNA polymerase sigma factor SigZ n=1 Tax=Dictyobacter kobayashii TaxID=2014872 RepID=A0A402AYE1_9CHLR|nr:RNA polymerase sigma factor SigZ [Dictyobacter kobayashii]GCE24126.1 RNA polymerase sigma factor SigZ [Dictyobacter kobayashii]
MGETPTEQPERSLSTEMAWYALHEPLKNFIRQRVNNEANVEDLLQDIFLKIHTHIASLKHEEKLESWVYQIARHRIIDYYRTLPAGVTLEEVSDSDTHLLYSDIPEEDARAQLIPSMMAMLSTLPEPYREALYLTDYKGLAQKELASRLGISISGAKSRVQRAREKLRQMLLDCCHLEFDRLGRLIDYQPRCHCCEPLPPTRTRLRSPEARTLPVVEIASR